MAGIITKRKREDLPGGEKGGMVTAPCESNINEILVVFLLGVAIGSVLFGKRRK